MKQLTIEAFKAMLDNALKQIKAREEEFSKNVKGFDVVTGHEAQKIDRANKTVTVMDKATGAILIPIKRAASASKDTARIALPALVFCTM